MCVSCMNMHNTHYEYSPAMFSKNLVRSSMQIHWIHVCIFVVQTTDIFSSKIAWFLCQSLYMYMARHYSVHYVHFLLDIFIKLDTFWQWPSLWSLLFLILQIPEYLRNYYCLIVTVYLRRWYPRIQLCHNFCPLPTIHWASL